MVRMVVGIGSRDVRSALFVALDALDGLRVAGSGTSAAEVITLCRTLQPDAVVIEDGLSDWTLEDLLDAIVIPMWSGDVLVISGAATTSVIDRYENVRLVEGIEEIAALVDGRRVGEGDLAS
jgi:DNA-binding NarL/FixJ family response regulator